MMPITAIFREAIFAVSAAALESSPTYSWVMLNVMDVNVVVQASESDENDDVERLNELMSRRLSAVHPSIVVEVDLLVVHVMMRLFSYIFESMRLVPLVIYVFRLLICEIFAIVTTTYHPSPSSLYLLGDQNNDKYLRSDIRYLTSVYPGASLRTPRSSRILFMSPIISAFLGPAEVGYTIATFLFGLATVQTYMYYQDFYTDPLPLKILVAVIWVAELMHQICLEHATYFYTVTSFGNFVVLLEKPPLSWEMIIPLTGLVFFLVTGFLVYRLWISTRSILLVATLSVLLTGRFALACVLTVLGHGTPSLLEFLVHHGNLISITWFCGTGVDVIMMAALCYDLYTQRHSLIYRASTRFDRCVMWCIATGLPSGVIGLAMSICFRSRDDCSHQIPCYLMLNLTPPPRNSDMDWTISASFARVRQLAHDNVRFPLIRNTLLISFLSGTSLNARRSLYDVEALKIVNIESQFRIAHVPEYKRDDDSDLASRNEIATSSSEAHFNVLDIRKEVRVETEAV
ncbi:hypothetical protein Hypma_002482 [Hypsizygus marmoreus]|uniref:Uncharacterized protein n=1 Tax=Hypsizygus marmoreus TaxID=39966 RepID=A0A369J467_HYPMA|nr:hypothetical protein Hypma_002482 [Hypsizygus marmoreus]